MNDACLFASFPAGFPPGGIFVSELRIPQSTGIETVSI
jgi:hypothetical protein